MKEQDGEEDTVCGGEGRGHPDWGQEERRGGYSEGGTRGDISRHLSGQIFCFYAQVATLANKFLHASYWFLVLGVTFSSKQLEGLARVARRREESSLESAKSLLGTLQKPNLAAILKPDWDAKESTVRAVQMLELLDGWLEEGVKEVQMKVGGSPDHLASILSRIGSTVRDFHWDSRAMRDRLSQD